MIYETVLHDAASLTISYVYFYYHLLYSNNSYQTFDTIYF